MLIDDIKVIDMTQGLCGPYAGLLLAEAGAEVVKVEPVSGDTSRHFGPPWIGRDSAVFHALNRNKSGFCVDETSSRGQAILLDLVAASDVLLADMNTPLLEQLRIDYDAARKANPQIIYCHITPFGENGPFADLDSSELVVQAMAGFTNSLTTPGEEPIRHGADLASTCTGVMAFSGVLAALYYLANTGEGQKVGVSMYGTLMQMREVFWAAISGPDEWEGFHCNSEVRGKEHGYATKDGRIYFNVHRADEDDFARLLIELGMEESLTDARFADGGRHAVGLGQYAHEVKGIWERAFRDKSTEDVLQIFADHNGSAAAINDYDSLFNHPHVQGLSNIDAVEHPSAGSVSVLRPLGKNGEDGVVPTPAPILGEHNERVLSGIGYGAEVIIQLRDEGVIVTDDATNLRAEST